MRCSMKCAACLTRRSWMPEIAAEMRLRHARRPHALQHHVAHGLLRLVAAAMARHQVQAQVDRGGRPRAGNQVALVDEQPVHHGAGLRKALAKSFQHVPVHADRARPDHAGLRQRESAGADAQQPHAPLGGQPEPVPQGLRHAPVDVVIAAAYRHVVELLGIVRQARRHVDGQARAGAARLAVPAHHPPGRVDLPAASAVIAGQAQGVDKTREGGQRELVQQHDANRERGFSRAGASASSS